jgi:hypothetical protein
MVQATCGDGTTLLALNEIFVGHRTHQSARYTLTSGQRRERHSSSGLIVCTGTGATGWAKSIHLQRNACAALPDPLSTSLTFLVREAWPSVVTQASLVDGVVAADEELVVTSEMNDGGVVFGDGIEYDRLDLPFGQVVALRRATQALRLVT